MQSPIRLAPALFATALFGLGCSHAQPTRTNDQPQFTAQQLKSASDDAKAKDTNNGLVAAGSVDLDAALAQLRGVTVFFAFDEATLTPEATASLSRVADVLNKYPNLSIQVQGNTDVRGTEQYNLALGQRRADAARDYLTRLGVKPGQISTVSFGEEKPKDPAHNDAAYQQNRRDDVVAK